MADQLPVEVTNLDRYDHDVLPWDRAHAVLSGSSGADITWFLGTVRPDGIDLNLEGTAHRVTDATMVKRVAALYAELGWPATAEGDAITAPFSAPSAGPAPWHLYRFSMRVAFGVATAEPHGATRWRFA
ncbi:pyridoxamine 5'-phosphate oxidase family protein [Nonomuraea sp. NPDC003709]|uniref:pyridoxamine 5'-phosphate oxidase family protein n=1 Tax=Nonomuraea sp. NPDC003709 TaxID=3154450 RepID=UPI0033A90D0D